MAVMWEEKGEICFCDFFLSRFHQRFFFRSEVVDRRQRKPNLLPGRILKNPTGWHLALLDAQRVEETRYWSCPDLQLYLSSKLHVCGTLGKSLTFCNCQGAFDCKKELELRKNERFPIGLTLSSSLRSCVSEPPVQPAHDIPLLSACLDCPDHPEHRLDCIIKKLLQTEGSSGK